MEKKWYKVSFYAEMSDEDIKAMNSSFYAAMEESMEIGPCEGLIIEEDKEIEVENDPVTTLNLEEDSYVVTELLGFLRIDKQIYDDYITDAFINIKFLDEKNQPVRQYQMMDEDEDWIYCDYIKDIA